MMTREDRDERAALKAALAEARAYAKCLEDQEVGQAMDCAKHEDSARADERAIAEERIQQYIAERDAALRDLAELRELCEAWRARAAKLDSRGSKFPYTGESDRSKAEAIEDCADALAELLGEEPSE